MYYVVKITEFKILKPDIHLIETTNTLEKAEALCNAMQAIHPDEKYKVLIAIERP